jgi:hypothetical protein
VTRTMSGIILLTEFWPLMLSSTAPPTSIL